MLVFGCGGAMVWGLGWAACGSAIVASVLLVACRSGVALIECVAWQSVGVLAGVAGEAQAVGPGVAVTCVGVVSCAVASAVCVALCLAYVVCLTGLACVCLPPVGSVLVL